MHWLFASRYEVVSLRSHSSLADRYADDLFLSPHDVVFQLEYVSGGTRRTPYKHLATTLGLYQLLYAFPPRWIYDALTHLGPAGDFAVEIGSELAYFASRITGRPPPAPTVPNLGQAFGVEDYSPGKAERAYTGTRPRARTREYGESEKPEALPRAL
jgi:hypothetical protein